MTHPITRTTMLGVLAAVSLEVSDTIISDLNSSSLQFSFDINLPFPLHFANRLNPIINNLASTYVVKTLIRPRAFKAIIGGAVHGVLLGTISQIFLYTFQLDSKNL